MKKRILSLIVIIILLVLAIPGVNYASRSAITVNTIGNKHQGDSVTISGCASGISRINLKIIDPKNLIIDIQTVDVANNLFTYTTKLKTDATLGKYSVVAGVGDEVCNTKFLVSKMSTSTPAPTTAADMEEKAEADKLARPDTNAAKAASKELAQRPYMGWSSFSLQVYDGPGNWTSAEKIKQQSDAMHAKLQSYGYEYINIDAGNMTGFDEYGRPVFDKKLYPNGIKEVIDYVHKNGQKVGTYLAPGVWVTAYNGNYPILGTNYRIQDVVVKSFNEKTQKMEPVVIDAWGGAMYKLDYDSENKDIADAAHKYIESVGDLLFGELGFDFLKIDGVCPGSGTTDLSKDARRDIEIWSGILDKYGVWLELSWALDHNYVDVWKKYANGWRVDWDIEAYNSKVGLVEWGTVARLFPDAALWWRDAGPGGWNDFDSLDIGNGLMSGLTKDERQTAMTLWASSCAPLSIGDDMTKIDNYGMSLLTNDEVIAVDQAGHPVHPVSTDTQQQVWYSNNGDGTYNVAVYNLGTKAADIHVNWKDIGLNGTGSVRDLWTHTELGAFADGYEVKALPPHGSRLFKVTAKTGSLDVNDDDIGISYSGNWKRNGQKEVLQSSQTLKIYSRNGNLIAPSTGSFVKNEQADITTTVSEGATQITSIKNGVTELKRDTDYVINGNNVTIKKEYLAAQPDGTTELLFSFGDGDSQTLRIFVKSSSETQTNNRYVYINNDDPSIYYKGSWARSSGRSFGDYMGDVQYTVTNNDYYEYSFQGIGISVITETDSGMGDIDIYIDDQFQRTVNTDSSTRRVQQAVYRVSGLPDGFHKLKVVKKSGNFMLLDELIVERPNLISMIDCSYDLDPEALNDLSVGILQNAELFSGVVNGDTPLVKGADYSVSGSNVTISKEYLKAQNVGIINLKFMFNGDYLNDVHYTETNGDSFTYTFSGTGIELLGPKGPDQGNMDLFIDDNYVTTLDTNNSVKLVQQSLYKVTGLKDGVHKIRGVKKSGNVMLMDQMKYDVSTGINPFSVKSASVRKTDGIVVTAKITPNGAGGHALVIFKLMDGKMPVGIIAMEEDLTSVKNVTAKFSKYSGSNYSVEILIWDQLNNKLNSIGTGLGDPVIVQ